MLMTPPIAFEPYKVLAEPRSTSIRSMKSAGRLAKLNDPRVGLAASTPSMSTSTWSSLDPRITVDVVRPNEPLRRTYTPGTLRRTSKTVSARCAWMSSLVTTLTDLVSLSRGTSDRVAETPPSSRRGVEDRSSLHAPLALSSKQDAQDPLLR